MRQRHELHRCKARTQSLLQDNQTSISENFRAKIIQWSMSTPESPNLGKNSERLVQACKNFDIPCSETSNANEGRRWYSGANVEC